MKNLPELLERALQVRASMLVSAAGEGALRLFAGFYEGCPQLVVDLYARTLLLHGYSANPAEAQALLEEAQAWLLEHLPQAGAAVNCVVHKVRAAAPALRRGRVAWGGPPDTSITENGVRYAVDLLLNRDASFYLDTRSLRAWLLEQARDWQVLNTFAYTGSLGVAALAGGAAQVVQVDLNRNFLELARRSAALNRLDWSRQKLRAADFFSEVAHLKGTGARFDSVIADPPFFSSTAKGAINLENETARLVNKLRPLVKDGGRLVMVNNALFLSGADYLRGLEPLQADGWLTIETLVPVPPDVTGFGSTGDAPLPADPAPFNHSTKIIIFRVRSR